MNEKEIAYIRFDYFGAIADYGLSHSVAFDQSINKSDFDGSEIDGLCVKKSIIDGSGLFSESDIGEGDVICAGRTGPTRTIAGRYTNHSPKNNAVFQKREGGIDLVAVKRISSGDEITVNYRDSLSLQLNRPTSNLPIGGLSANKDGVALVPGDTPRAMLSGIDAIAYDLLFNVDAANNLRLRDRILAFESITENLPQAEFRTEHEFIDGLYKRQVTIKAGTLATGRIHPVDHMDVMISGEMLVASDDGFKLLKAPLTLTSRAWEKKAGYALTDVVWATYHPTSATTVEEVEREIFSGGFNEIEGDIEVAA